MLPEITLKSVSREDVDRLAWWLEDQELSSRWFGHYACGDPVHRGYDPQHMLEAPDAEWQRVFDDSHRLIFSIYAGADEHVGESQIVLDGDGGAELALLIGRKDLWHHGFGTAAVMDMLDKAFGELGLDRAWVNVPEDNAPALGFFEKLGFLREGSRELCRNADGTVLTSSILAIASRAYRVSRPGDTRNDEMPVVTITGLLGSTSESIAQRVARLTGRKLIGGDEITEQLCRRLKCTVADLRAFEGSHRTFWTRFLNSIAVPLEWSATYDAGSFNYYRYPPDALLDDDYVPGVADHISKKRYNDALSAVVRRFAAEGRVVLHGLGSRLHVPSNVASINVFVSASQAFRGQRFAAEQGLGPEEAALGLERTERDQEAIFKHLHDADPMEMELYDLTLNAERLSIEVAADVVLGAIESGIPALEPAIDAQVSSALIAR
jgi:RimJ/RimL family protein N-acetyltransferase/cytidylate kinase